MCVDSSRIDESIEAVRSLGVTRIGISAHHGYHLPDLRFLEQYPAIERLDIPFASDHDLTPLWALVGLKALTLFESRAELSASWFPALEELQTEWHARLPLSGAARLARLFLRGYKSGTAGLTLLPPLPMLKHLDLTQARFASLDGIERLPALTQFELHYVQGRKEGASSCALADTLTSVFCSHVRSGVDLTVLRCLRSLERLRLNQCGVLPSTQFLNHLPKLREFRFVQTVVEDGDLSPLLRLDEIGFFDRRGYSHKSNDIEKAMAARRLREAE
jgi:hypothetical protein